MARDETTSSRWKVLWQSRARVLLCMYGGMALAAFNLVGSYVLWLHEGCKPFLPWVSDFAGLPLFQPCTILASILLIPSWFDYWHATKCHLVTSQKRWRRLHSSLPCMGVWCSGSLIGVAANPWDVRFHMHMMFAACFFDGGIVFALATCLVDHRRGLATRRTLLAVCIAMFALVFMIFFISRGLREGGNSMVFHSLALMRHDFRAYCEGPPGTIHHNENVNFAAASEWVLIGTLLLVAFVKLYQELAISESSLCSDAKASMAERFI